MSQWSSRFSMKKRAKRKKPPACNRGGLPDAVQHRSRLLVGCFMECGRRLLAHSGSDEGSYGLVAEPGEPLNPNRTRKRARHA